MKDSMNRHGIERRSCLGSHNVTVVWFTRIKHRKNTVR